MWQGDLVVQSRRMDYERDAGQLFGLCDKVARFSQTGGVTIGASPS
jgi:hypothetical protein